MFSGGGNSDHQMFEFCDFSDEEGENSQPADDDGLLRDCLTERPQVERTVVFDETIESDILCQCDERDTDTVGGGEGKGGRTMDLKGLGISPLKRFSFGLSNAENERQQAEALKAPAKSNKRINLEELSDPLLVPSKKNSVQEEFYGVYCLVSRSAEKHYVNRCYVGYTVDPERRIRQHNSGRQHGGAKKTDSRGPWEMVCIVHGFPNAISALRFEWAWQNPDRSKRLKGAAELKKNRKESPFEFRFRVVCQMLSSHPWREMGLTLRWLISNYQIQAVNIPPQMRIAHGKVQKTFIAVPTGLRDYTTLGECLICKTRIGQLNQLVKCPAAELCYSHFHARCLAEHCLETEGQLFMRLVPVSGRCPKCAVDFLWGDLVREQKTLLLIDEAKPVQEGIKFASEMIPKKMKKV